MMKTICALLMVAGVHAFAQEDRRLSEEDRAKFRAAHEACISETGVTRVERGQRPSEEDRAKMDACLAAKGISKPEFRRHPRHPASGSGEEEATAAR